MRRSEVKKLVDAGQDQKPDWLLDAAREES